MDEIKLADKLQDYHLTSDPFQSFEDWLAKAKEVEQSPEAMALATASNDGTPSVRMILYKGMKDQKLPIYTNLGSQKAKELQQNPRAALVFWWPKLGRQIRITGNTEKMDPQQAEQYFHSRSRLSQIASLTSNQSQPISGRVELEEKFNQNRDKLKDIPTEELPFSCESWGGHWLIPQVFEFFLYRDHRLNDRFLYRFEAPKSTWNIQRLQP